MSLRTTDQRWPSGCRRSMTRIILTGHLALTVLVMQWASMLSSRIMNPTSSPLQDSLPADSDAEQSDALTSTEEERAMAALESIGAGRARTAATVRQRAEALLP